jgi:hypothetical protein
MMPRFTGTIRATSLVLRKTTSIWHLARLASARHHVGAGDVRGRVAARCTGQVRAGRLVPAGVVVTRYPAGAFVMPLAT